MPEPSTQCPAVHNGMACIKPLYTARNGEIWDHAGGHFFTTPEGAEALRSGNYDGEAVLRSLRRVSYQEPGRA